MNLHIGWEQIFYMLNNLIDFITKSDNVITGLHLDIKHDAATFTILIHDLDELSLFLVAALNSSNIFESYVLSTYGFIEDNLLA